VAGRWTTGGPSAVPGGDCPGLDVDAAGDPSVGVCISDRPSSDVEPSETRCDVVFVAGGPQGWTRTTVSVGGEGRVSLDLDRRGGAHLTFGSIDTDQVLYGTNTSGRWIVERVAGGTVVPSPAIAVDRSGVPQIAYASRPDASTVGSIYYATLRGATWRRSLLATHTNSAPNIGVDRNGSVSVAFTRPDSSGSSVYLVTNTSGRWVTTMIASGAQYGTPALALDESGAAHVAYVTPSGIVHASNAGGTWRTSLVTADPRDAQPSLDVDTAGTVHLAFLRMQVGIYYAHT
jgi:hypothetical protein